MGRITFNTRIWAASNSFILKWSSEIKSETEMKNVSYIWQKNKKSSYGLTTQAEFIYPEIAQEQFLGK